MTVARRAVVRSPVRIEVLGIPKQGVIAGRAAAQLAEMLEAVRYDTLDARLRFTDDNGPKGGVAIRCGIRVKVGRQPTIQVEHVAATAALASDGALAKLERRIARLREEIRKSRRYPQKYFAAARELLRS